MITAKMNEDKKQTSEYPKLRASQFSVVLFISEKEGTVVCMKEGGMHPIGETRTDWIASTFEDFHGSITLTNT